MFELGSGFGYSAYWFARAVGPGGEVHGDGRRPGERAEGARLPRPRRRRRPDPLARRRRASTSLAAVEGEFDVVFYDIDKPGYPDAWRAARERIRVGGLYLCDNMLWSGRGRRPGGRSRTGREDPEAIREHNRLIAEDERYVSIIVPTRDGVLVALRIALSGGDSAVRSGVDCAGPATGRPRPWAEAT